MTSSFWVSAVERAVKSFAQSLLAIWGGGVFNVLSVNWGSALGIAAGAAVLSLLTSLVSLPFGPSDSPSVVRETGRHERPDGLD
jgi:hypothetical protein